MRIFHTTNDGIVMSRTLLGIQSVSGYMVHLLIHCNTKVIVVYIQKAQQDKTKCYSHI